MRWKWLILVCAVTLAVPVWAEDGDSPSGASRPGPKAGQYRYLTLGQPNLRYTVVNQPQTENQIALFESLTPKEQEIFRARQMGFLNKLARVLHWSRRGIGAGVYVVDQFFRVLPTKEQWGNPIRAVRERFRKNEDVHEVKPQPEAKSKGSLSDRGKRVTQAILNFANQQMWEHAPVVARNNEHSLMVMAGGGGGVGAKTKSLYAEGLLGIKLGYNHERRALVFQFFSDVERMRFVFPVLARLPNVGVKAGVSIAQSGPEGIAESSRPTGRYPPGPLEMVGSPKEMNAMATLGIGIPPFNTFAYMETEVSRNPLLHFELGAQGVMVRGKFAKGMGMVGRSLWRGATAPLRLGRAACHMMFGSLGAKR